MTRFIIFLSATSAAALSVFIHQVKDIWLLSFDIVYIILFPHLFCALYLRSASVFGSIPAVLVGLFLYLSAGYEPLGLPTFIKYPLYDETVKIQTFPYRTLAMLSSFLTLILVSLIASKCRRERRRDSILETDEVMGLYYISMTDKAPFTSLSHPPLAVKHSLRNELTPSYGNIVGRAGSYNCIAASADDLSKRTLIGQNRPSSECSSSAPKTSSLVFDGSSSVA